MALNTNVRLGLAQDTGIVYRQGDVSDVVDNVFCFQDLAGQKFHYVAGGGPYIARAAGILPGSDKTSLLNTIFAHSAVKEVVIDGGVITINGTLTIPAGKIITFQNGSRFTGSGTINGGYINAGVDQHIFDTSLTVVPYGMLNGEFSVKWYGAIGKGATNDTLALQKSIDVVVNSTEFNTLVMPVGDYRIDKGLLAFFDPNLNADPDQVRLKIRGLGTGYVGGKRETTITCAHNDNFAIAIQEGKGVQIENINFIGPNQLNYSQATAWNPATTYVTGGARTNVNSPFAAIVIDPFGSSTTGADRYPDFEGYYAGIIGNGGSTNVNVKDVYIDGFVVGIMLTPNTNTQNNECHKFDNIWMSNLRDGFVTTNSQERTVLCTRFNFWNSTKTCFRNNGYGLIRGEVPFIDIVNVAGNIYQIFDFQGAGGAFPTICINRVYAESFYRIGTIVGITVEHTGCHYALALVSDIIGTMKSQDWVYAASPTVFRNSAILFYNGGTKCPLNMSGKITFDNCLLSQPVGKPVNSWSDNHYEIKYTNGTNFYTFNGALNRTPFYSFFSGTANLTNINRELKDYGDEYVSYSWGIQYGGNADRALQIRKVLSPFVRRVPISGSIAVTVTGSTATATIPQFIGSGTYWVDKLVCSFSLNQGQLMRINTVDNATGATTFTRVIESFVSGTYNSDLFIEDYQAIEPLILCDISGFSLSNVIGEGATTLGTLTVGNTYYLHNRPISITAAAVGTATGNAGSVHGSENRVFLSPYSYEESGYSNEHPLTSSFWSDGRTFTKGAFYKNTATGSNILGWRVITSGIKGSAYPPEFETVYAGPDKFTSGVSTSRTVSADELIAYVAVNPASDLAAFKIGNTNGGTEFLPDTFVPAGQWTVFNIGALYAANGSIYLGGVTSSTQFKIYRQ